ncbi:hypothetical protein V8F33_013712 [Rhypophila sp. PSN 637]
MANATAAAPEPLSQEYINESRVHWILIPVAIFSFLVIVLVGLRFWARRLGTGNGLRADDWTCLAATIFALTTNALFIAMTFHGFGRHVKTVAPQSLSQGLFLWWFAQITYKISLQLTKISLLQLYLRIFGHLIPWFKRTAYALICLLAIYTIATCSVSFAQCTPITDAWAVHTPAAPPSGGDGSRAPMRPSKNCINLKAFFIFNGTFALLTDLIVLLVPIPLIYTLNPARHQKVALIPLFALGTFIVVISAQRVFFLVTSKPGRDDLTYDLMSTLWTIIEYNLGLVCACAPIVRVFVLKVVVWGGVDGSLRGDGGLRVLSASGGTSGRGSSRGLRNDKGGGGLDLDDEEFDLVDGGSLGISSVSVRWNLDSSRSKMDGNSGGGKYGAYYGDRGAGRDTTAKMGRRKGTQGGYPYAKPGAHARNGSNAGRYGYDYRPYLAGEWNTGRETTSNTSKRRQRDSSGSGLQVDSRYLGRHRPKRKHSTTTGTTTATTRAEEEASDSDSGVSLILQTPEPLISPMSRDGRGDVDDGGSSAHGNHGGMTGVIQLQRTVSPRYGSSGYDVDNDYRAQGLR